MSESPLNTKILKTDDVSDMKIPRENGEVVRIIAQSQFDVNQENIEGTVFVGSSTGSRMVFSRWKSELAPASENRCLDRDIP
jgi:hypothetical protein